MPPSSLNGIYQQYKADTDVVAQWLAVTAKEHGYSSVGSSPALSNTATGGRLKGKARKQAKAAISGQTSSTANTGPKTTHIIKTKDFESMAVHIASCSGIAVPRNFSRSLDRVISVRKNFAERLASNGVDVSAESSKSHSFFVEVLEKVKQALHPLLSTMQAHSVSTAIVAPAAVSGQPKGLFNNMFGALEMYQTSANFENQPDVVPPPPTQIQYVAEQGTSSVDLVFAVTALLDDYAKLRAAIRNLWSEHAAGRLDLAAVSVATNTAFELAHNMEDDVTPLLEATGGMYVFVTKYFHSLCKASGLDAMAKEHPQDPYNLGAYDIADVCFMNTLTLIHSFTATALPERATFQDYNGKFGWYDDTHAGLAQSNRQKWTQDMTAVLELMSDLGFLVSKLRDLSVVDELTRGLAYQVHERRETTPLWLAFGVQVYLDILHNFGQTCDGLGTMQAESHRIKQSLLDVPVADRCDVLRAAGLWDDDPIWAARKLAVTAGMLPRVRSPPFKFLRRNPMYCGLLIQNMRATLQNAGLLYAVTPGALVGVVQLYHALQHEGLLADDCVWEDLQTLWTLQGDSSFFVGDLPKTREAYFNNYCLSVGTSVTHRAAAQSRRKTKGKFKTHSHNQRNLMPLGYLSHAVNLRLEHPGKLVPWSTNAVQESLAAGFAQRYTDSRSHIRSEFKAKVGEAGAQYAALPPAGLIREVAEAIMHEKPGLCFNFFTMHNEA